MIISLRMTVDLRDNTCKIFSSVALTLIFVTRKRFSEKPIVAFTNSTVFILHVKLNLFGLIFWP